MELGASRFPSAATKFAASNRASSQGQKVGGRAAARLLLEVEIAELARKALRLCC